MRSEESEGRRRTKFKEFNKDKRRAHGTRRHRAQKTQNAIVASFILNMSNYGVPTAKLKEARSKLPPIKLSSFVDPREPWVLVPDGNLLGFFGWVPKNLRIGRWSKLAIPTLGLVASVLLYHRPTGDYPDIYVSSYPTLFSNLWWYNIIAFLCMAGIVAYILIYRTKGAIVTFTLLSWGTNMLRHGINFLVPFLHDNHALLRLNHMMRFPALVSASITCAIWNLVLLPYVYNFAFEDSKEKKANFVKFNFNPRMVQLHVCNIIYAIMNTVVTMRVKDTSDPILFELDDLWYGATYTFLYGLFYLMVLDRIGVHIYPVFSPRSNFVAITWCTVFSLTFGFYRFWNWMMVHHWDSLRLELLVGIDFGIMSVMFAFDMYLQRHDASKSTADNNK